MADTFLTKMQSRISGKVLWKVYLNISLCLEDVNAADDLLPTGQWGAGSLSIVWYRGACRDCCHICVGRQKQICNHALANPISKDSL